MQSTTATPELLIEIECGELRVERSSDPADEIDSRCLEYWVSGLRCVGLLRGTFDFGTVAVHGTAKSTDTLDGRILVVPKVGLSIVEIEEGVDRVLSVLSMASGQLLRWGVRQRLSDDKIEMLVLRRTALHSPMWPPFSFVGLQPVFEAAAANYTTDLVARTGIDVAVALHAPRQVSLQLGWQ